MRKRKMRLNVRNKEEKRMKTRKRKMELNEEEKEMREINKKREAKKKKG